MPRLETLKINLKKLAANDMEQAFKETEYILSSESKLFDALLLLLGQFKKCREKFLLGLISQEQNAQTNARITAGLLQLISDLTEFDLSYEERSIPQPAQKRGEMLYRIPRKMQCMREEKCIVRIAWTETALFDNWTRNKDDVRRENLRIAEIMGVELVNLSEDTPFAIRTLHATIQFLDSDDYTEWIFYVKPLRAGHYPLMVRISVIEMRDNREVKRDLVLEEKINVLTEVPQTDEKPDELVRAPMARFSAGATQPEIPFPAPSINMGSIRRYGTLLALILLFVVGVLFDPAGKKPDDVVIDEPSSITDTFDVAPIDKDAGDIVTVDTVLKEKTHPKRMTPLHEGKPEIPVLRERIVLQPKINFKDLRPKYLWPDRDIRLQRPLDSIEVADISDKISSVVDSINKRSRDSIPLRFYVQYDNRSKPLHDIKFRIKYDSSILKDRQLLLEPALVSWIDTPYIFHANRYKAFWMTGDGNYSNDSIQKRALIWNRKYTSGVFVFKTIKRKPFFARLWDWITFWN